MEYKIISNKIVEDIVSHAALGLSRPAFFSHCKEFIEGDIQPQKNPVNSDKKATSKSTSFSSDDEFIRNATADTEASKSFKRHVSCEAGRVARAFYLAGCFLTAPVELLFGWAADGEKSSASMGSNAAPRSFGGLFRAKPAIKPFAVQDGLLGGAYAGVEGVFGWIAGNVGALVGATCFALMYGFFLGARWSIGKIYDRLQHAGGQTSAKAPDACVDFEAGFGGRSSSASLDSLADAVGQKADWPSEKLASKLQQVARVGDTVGATIVALPLRLLYSALIASSILLCTGIRGVMCALGGSVGASVGAQRSMIDNEGQFTVWGAVKAAGSRLAELNTCALDFLDGRRGLRRAVVENEKRMKTQSTQPPIKLVDESMALSKSGERAQLRRKEIRNIIDSHIKANEAL